MIDEFAPAKVNLSLCVRGRRLDGFHDLESLVVFSTFGDRVTFTPQGNDYALTTAGPKAKEAGATEDNLVLKAANRLASLVPSLPAGHFTLDKRIPVAAGLGGGSSDAAAALRCLARAADLAPDHPAIMEAARATGADVTVCLGAKPRMMRGMGHDLGPVLTLPPLWLLLVNPNVAVPTDAVFKQLGLSPGQSFGTQDPCALYESQMAPDALLALVKASRNDLQEPALALEPVIAEAMNLAAGLEGCRLARMSGSGATIFGLFTDGYLAQAGAKRMGLLRREWWATAHPLLP